MPAVDLKDYEGETYYTIRGWAALDKKDPLLSIEKDFSLACQLVIMNESGQRNPDFETDEQIRDPINAVDFVVRCYTVFDKKDPFLKIPSDLALAHQLQVLRELGGRPDGFEPTEKIHEPINASNGEAISCIPS